MEAIREGEQMYFVLRRQGVPAKIFSTPGNRTASAATGTNVHRMISELGWINTYVKQTRTSF